MFMFLLFIKHQNSVFCLLIIKNNKIELKINNLGGVLYEIPINRKTNSVAKGN
jgi:hypothetical protein